MSVDNAAIKALVNFKINWILEGEENFYDVLDNFPGISKEEIRVEYNPFNNNGVMISFIDSEMFDSSGIIIMDPIVTTGNSFPLLPKEYQQARFAHEIGHYRQVKDFTDDELRHSFLMCQKVVEMEQGSIISAEETKKLEEWSLATEIYADNQALIAGYGQNILQDLSNYSDEKLTKLGIKEKYARIKNLERRIE